MERLWVLRGYKLVSTREMYLRTYAYFVESRQAYPHGSSQGGQRSMPDRSGELSPNESTFARTGNCWTTFSTADMMSCSTNRLSAASGATVWVTLLSVSSKHDTSSSEPTILTEPSTSARTASTAISSVCALVADLQRMISRRLAETGGRAYFSTRARLEAG